MTLEKAKDFYKQFKPGEKVHISILDIKNAVILKSPHCWGTEIYCEVKTPEGTVTQINVNRLTIIAKED